MAKNKKEKPEKKKEQTLEDLRLEMTKKLDKNIFETSNKLIS